MITVEVVFDNAVEIHNVPSMPDLDWSSNNILALQHVYDCLRERVLHDGLDLSGLRSMCARNPEWKPEWND